MVWACDQAYNKEDKEKKTQLGSAHVQIALAVLETLPTVEAIPAEHRQLFNELVEALNKGGIKAFHDIIPEFKHKPVLAGKGVPTKDLDDHDQPVADRDQVGRDVRTDVGRTYEAALGSFHAGIGSDREVRAGTSRGY